MKPVLCLGDACMDLIIPYAAVLKVKFDGSADHGETEVQQRSGGSVANTACAIARLGVPVRFAGTCGTDSFGIQLRRDLEGDGVDASLLRMDDIFPTQLVMLVLNEQGDRTAFAFPAHGGAQHAILHDQLPKDIVEQIGWLHVSGMMLREEPAASTQLDLMRRCRSAGIPVSFDVNARIESLGDLQFLRNLSEARQYCSVIFGSAVDEIPLLAAQRDAETAAASLAANGAVVIARNGAQGAVLYCGEVRRHFPAFSVPISDTVGAGDTFDGAFIAARMRGFDPFESVRRANAAAAICVSRPGGRSCPTEAELTVFLAHNSNE